MPDLGEVARVTGRDTLVRPSTPFLAMHAAVTLLALDDTSGLRQLEVYADSHRHPTQRAVVAPLARGAASPGRR